MLIEVNEVSQAGEARRRAINCAEDLQFEEPRRGAVAIATSEMATNLVKHASRGQILLHEIQHDRYSGLRVMAVDHGPGISDVTRALGDGHSTAGSLGTGLGAIRRLSDAFEIYSVPGMGTIVRADFWREKKIDTVSPPYLEIGYVSEPIQGEDVCGDGWSVRMHPGSMLMMVVDGLGHGVLANEAAREAQRVFSETRHSEPHRAIQDVHAALKKTRGAALAIARLDFEKRVLIFAGVGNISAHLLSPASSRGLPSHNGTLGQYLSKVQEFSYPWNPDSILVMHSDGLSSRWDLQKYPGIWNKHASIIAAALHRDFCRGRDDVTVFVAKAA